MKIFLRVLSGKTVFALNKHKICIIAFALTAEMGTKTFIFKAAPQTSQDNKKKYPFVAFLRYLTIQLLPMTSADITIL